LIEEKVSASPLRQSLKDENSKKTWKIIEIKAEKI
jgi:hypothetical protein